MDLSAEKNERNQESLVRLVREGNELIPRVVRGETTCLAEAQDLFWFFQRRFAYMRTWFRIPKLRPKHDKRVKDLTDVVQAVDLLPDDREPVYFRLKAEANARGGYPSPNTDQLQTYCILRGTDLNFSSLYEDQMRDYLQTQKRWGLTFLGLATLGLAFIPIGFAAQGLHEGDPFMQRTVKNFGLVSTGMVELVMAFASYMIGTNFVPEPANTLTYKANLIDNYLQQQGQVCGKDELAHPSSVEPTITPVTVYRTS